jgi:hypothetical protein
MNKEELSIALEKQQERLDEELLESYVAKDLTGGKKREREVSDHDSSNSDDEEDSSDDGGGGGRAWLAAAKKRLKIMRKVQTHGAKAAADESPPPEPTGDIFLDHECQRRWAERQKEKKKMKRFLSFAGGPEEDEGEIASDLCTRFSRNAFTPLRHLFGISQLHSLQARLGERNEKRRTRRKRTRRRIRRRRIRRRRTRRRRTRRRKTSQPLLRGQWQHSSLGPPHMQFSAA